MKPRLWPILLASAIGIMILLSLGVWQVQRLAWKEGLIAELDSRLKAEPISLQQAMEKKAAGQDLEYVKVKLTGQIDGNNLRKVASINGEPGWEILLPFKTNEGQLVLVDLGAIAENQSYSAKSEPQSFEAVIRIHNKGAGLFDADNDPEKNIWYWWDLPEMMATAFAKSDGAPVPFILQKLPTPNDNNMPMSEHPKVELTNNHLGYAITWFGLAAALAGVAGFYVFSLRRKSEA